MAQCYPFFPPNSSCLVLKSMSKICCTDSNITCAICSYFALATHILNHAKKTHILNKSDGVYYKAFFVKNMDSLHWFFSKRLVTFPTLHFILDTRIYRTLHRRVEPAVRPVGPAELACRRSPAGRSAEAHRSTGHGPQRAAAAHEGSQPFCVCVGEPYF